MRGTVGGGWSDTDQSLSVIHFLRADVAVPAGTQLPPSDHAVRAMQLPAGQRRLDTLSDGCFHALLGGEQYPHMNLAGGAGCPAVVRRQGTWRLMIPVPAQRCRDCPTWSPQVSVRFHHQDCVMSKCLAHLAIMRVSAKQTCCAAERGLWRAEDRATGHRT